jgi:hypothetical protein
MRTLHRSEPVRPLARDENLLIEEVDGEVVVYDLDRDEAHCLNDTAAHVWRLCDGKRSPQEISEAIGDPGAPLGEEVVWQALSQLHRRHLLASPARLPQHISRRDLARKAALWTAAGVLALPTIKSIVAPTSAHALSLQNCCQYQCAGVLTGCQECSGTATCPQTTTIGGNQCTLVNVVPVPDCTVCPTGCAP